MTLFTPSVTNAIFLGISISIMLGFLSPIVVAKRLTFLSHAVPSSAFVGASLGAFVPNLVSKFFEGANKLSNSTIFIVNSNDSYIGIICIGIAVSLMIYLLREKGDNSITVSITLSFILGIGAIFFTTKYLLANEAESVAFGQIFGIGSSQIILGILVSLLALSVCLPFYRSYWLSSITLSPDSLSVSPARADLAIYFSLGLLGAAITPIVGGLIGFALIVGPGAIANNLASTPIRASFFSAALGAVLTFFSIIISVASNWPPGFLIAIGIVAGYFISQPFKK